MVGLQCFDKGSKIFCAVLLRFIMGSETDSILSRISQGAEGFWYPERNFLDTESL